MKMKYVVSGLVSVLVIGGIGWLYVSGSPNNTGGATPTASDAPTNTPATPSTTSSKIYASDEVAQHASASSCWMIIDSKVYDVTKFIPEHPGGSQMLQGCGKDATSLFNGDTSSHDHSNSARSQLEGYYIGDLKA